MDKMRHVFVWRVTLLSLVIGIKQTDSRPISAQVVREPRNKPNVLSLPSHVDGLHKHVVLTRKKPHIVKKFRSPIVATRSLPPNVKTFGGLHSTTKPLTEDYFTSSSALDGSDKSEDRLIVKVSTSSPAVDGLHKRMEPSPSALEPSASRNIMHGFHASEESSRSMSTVESSTIFLSTRKTTTNSKSFKDDKASGINNKNTSRKLGKSLFIAAVVFSIFIILTVLAYVKYSRRQDDKLFNHTEAQLSRDDDDTVIFDRTNYLKKGSNLSQQNTQPEVTTKRSQAKAPSGSSMQKKTIAN